MYFIHLGFRIERKTLKLILDIMSITYHIGDALYPVGVGNKILVHICNNVGAWGGGFTKPLTKRWKEPKIAYRKLKSRTLGSVEFIKVENEIKVANIIGQVFHYRHGPPIRYAAVCTAMQIVAQKAKLDNATVHMPRIGCGLAGGNWKEIETILQRTLVNVDVHVHVYDL